MEEKEPTLKSINTNLNNLSGNVNNLTDNLNDLTGKVSGLTDNMNDLMGFLQEHMVTKEDLRKSQNKLKQEFFDAMDKKLASLKGELVSLMRKLSKQLNELIGTLRNKEVLAEKETDHLLSLAPFPR